jgi:hypothetical protein
MRILLLVLVGLIALVIMSYSGTVLWLGREEFLFPSFRSWDYFSEHVLPWFLLGLECALLGFLLLIVMINACLQLMYGPEAFRAFEDNEE